MSKFSKKPNWRGWLKNPKNPRSGEVIGGSFWVFRRGDDTKRIRPAMWPYEYGSMADAQAEAVKLATKNRGETFIVVMQQSAIMRSEITEEIAA